MYNPPVLPRHLALRRLMQRKATTSEVSLKDIRDRAIRQPFERLQELRTTGAVLVAVARPRRSISTALQQGLRWGWDTVSASRAGPPIAGFLNASAASFCNWGIFAYHCAKGSDPHYLTGKDIRDWTPPVPDPKTLVQARQTAEKWNRKSPFQLDARGCFL